MHEKIDKFNGLDRKELLHSLHTLDYNDDLQK